MPKSAKLKRKLSKHSKLKIELLLAKLQASSDFKCQEFLAIWPRLVVRSNKATVLLALAIEVVLSSLWAIIVASDMFECETLQNHESHCGPFKCFGAAPCGSSKPTPIHTPWAPGTTWNNSWCLGVIESYSCFSPDSWQGIGVLTSQRCMVLIGVVCCALAPWHLSHCRQRPPPHGGRRGAPGEVFYNCCFIIFINNLSYLSIVLYCLTVFPKHFPNIFPLQWLPVTPIPILHMKAAATFHSLATAVPWLF